MTGETIRRIQTQSYLASHGSEALGFSETLRSMGLWTDASNEREMILIADGARHVTAEDTPIRFVITTAHQDYRAEVEKIWTIMLSLVSLLSLISLFAAGFVESHVMRPIEEITAGVQAVIAGDSDFMWPVDDSSPFVALSHQLNVMSARLQGKIDPDADPPEATGSWAAIQE